MVFGLVIRNDFSADCHKGLMHYQIFTKVKNLKKLLTATISPKTQSSDLYMSIK